jgi:hypothetical protein
MIGIIIGIIVVVGIISYFATGDATDVVDKAGDAAASAANKAGDVAKGVADKAGDIGSKRTAESAPTYKYAKYNDDPYWDGGDKLTCPTAVGVNLTGNRGDYANYCIFTGNDAEKNAQNACSSISNCAGYVTNGGPDPMYQLTTMPRGDTGSPHHRFYAKDPLPKGVVIPEVKFIRPTISFSHGGPISHVASRPVPMGFRAKPPKVLKPSPPPPPRPPPHMPPRRRKGFTNERPDLYMSDNPGYHSDIQALGGHPHMNLV